MEMKIKYGKFLDDISEEFEKLVVEYEYGNLSISIPPCKKKFVIDPNFMGNMYSSQEAYDELMGMTIKELNYFRDEFREGM